MPQIRQGTLDAAVAPGSMLFRHADHELLDLLGDTGSAQLATLRAPVKLLGDQSLVPPHEGVGGHKGGDVFEALATQWVGERGEAAAFGVSQTELAATELSFQDAVFLDQIRDHLLLVTLEPAGNHGDEHVEDHGLSSGWKL